MKREGFITFDSIVECTSGTRVGGSDDELAIGGVDLPAIKHPVTKEPYLPGSSMKGRLRSELEKELGKFGGGGSQPCDCAEGDCPVCRLFGPHNASKKRDAVTKLGPTRIIVRDLPWVKTEEKQEPVWENKTENIINRRTGAAEHPRTGERVPSGTQFKFQVTVQFYDEDKNFEFRGKKGAEAFVRAICLAIKGVEGTGLGSGVSRGSGQIKFGKVEVKFKGEPLPCD